MDQPTTESGSFGAQVIDRGLYGQLKIQIEHLIINAVKYSVSQLVEALVCQCGQSKLGDLVSHYK